MYDWDDNAASATTPLGETTYIGLNDQGAVEKQTTNSYNARGRLTQTDIDQGGD